MAALGSRIAILTAGCPPLRCAGQIFVASAQAARTLFRLRPDLKAVTRLVVCEAPIDALSLAAIEGLPGGTLYAATTGGMGPGTIRAIETHLAEMAERREGVLIAAIDRDAPGERYTQLLAGMAAAAVIGFERKAPGLKDWNDELRGRGS